MRVFSQCAILMFYKSYSVNIELNNLYAMYLVFWCMKANATYTGKLRNFEKPECQLRNFYTIMSWLKETIELSNLTYKKKAITEAKIKID